METEEKQIFEAFASQLCEWTKTGKKLNTGNQDINYGLKLQKERLDTISEHKFSDSKYTNLMMSRDYNKTVNYYIEERKCLSVKEKETLYTFVTRLNDMNTVQNETYCCPNCPYCQTDYDLKMDDWVITYIRKTF